MPSWITSSTDPKRIDLVEGAGGRAVALRGIYRLDGGRLTVCLGVAAARDGETVQSERPDAFEAAKDVQLLRLERRKE